MYCRYDPDEGTIFVDGKDIKDYNVQWLRSRMGLVNQEPQLMPTSIFQNIALGGLSLTSTASESSQDKLEIPSVLIADAPQALQERVLSAARNSNAHSFISKLNDGYDTYLSSSQLSGGQKQRSFDLTLKITFKIFILNYFLPYVYIEK